MAFSVKDESTDAAVRKLAKLKNMSLTETIRDAVEQEYQRSRGAIPCPSG
ncbi:MULTISPECIES: type II toxin-antitoxin system VapB family antitoxin [unclassified Mesorhizobium]|nr:MULTISPECIES: type II toxin-antitoxin system VapB family antitoxin [unclassified Mesorhizobium]